MSDYLVRATAADDFVRAFAVTSRDLTDEARRRHGLSPVAAAALGRTMAGALMMGVDMKGERDLMTLQFLGDGPLGSVIVTADSHGNVKGFVQNPDVALPLNRYGKLDVGGAVGSGRLRVLKDIGLKEPYTGEVEIQSGEIAQDLTYYFAVSEQVPSVVALGVLVNPGTREVLQAGGYIIQVMPDCPDEIVSELERVCTASEPVTTLLANGGTPESILIGLLSGLDVHITDSTPVRFRCDCSRERVTKALIAMGRGELSAMAAEGKPVTLSCHFCNTQYEFTPDELYQILESQLRVQ